MSDPLAPLKTAGRLVRASRVAGESSEAVREYLDACDAHNSAWTPETTMEVVALLELASYDLEFEVSNAASTFRRNLRALLTRLGDPDGE